MKVDVGEDKREIKDKNIRIRIGIRIKIRTGILRWGRGHNIGGGRCAGDADVCDGDRDGDECDGVGGGGGDDCDGDSGGSD